MSLADSIRQFCSDHHLRLNTDLGQHFLIDQDVLDAIVATADIQEDDRIVEIGPGIGVLTKELLKHAGHVTAIEFDKRLIPLLQNYINEQRTTNNELTIIQGNALHVDLPSSPYKIVANIPYHITSPLLRHVFLESTVLPTSMTLLIQREVAEKICATASEEEGDTEDAGLLTILVALFGTPCLIMPVPPSSFLPPPKVDSAVVHIECFAEPKADRKTVEKIFALTKSAFGQKRKMLRNTLGKMPEGMERLEKLGIAPERRPQTLSIEEWIALAEAFSQS